MPAADVDGTSIYYEREGHGPPLLMIHSLGSSGDEWAFQRDEFARLHREAERVQRELTGIAFGDVRQVDVDALG